MPPWHAGNLASRWRVMQENGDMQCISESCTSMAPSTMQYFFLLDGTWIVHILNNRARDGIHGHGRPFLKRVLINNFGVSRQLAEWWEVCLPSPSPTRARWLAAWGETFAYKRWTCSSSFGVRLPEVLLWYHHYCSTSGRGEEPSARSPTNLVQYYYSQSWSTFLEHG